MLGEGFDELVEKLDQKLQEFLFACGFVIIMKEGDVFL